MTMGETPMSNELYRYGPSRYIEISKSQHQQQRHVTRRSRVITLYDAWESKLPAALFRHYGLGSFARDQLRVAGHRQ